MNRLDSLAVQSGFDPWESRKKAQEQAEKQAQQAQLENQSFFSKVADYASGIGLNDMAGAVTPFNTAANAVKEMAPMVAGGVSTAADTISNTDAWKSISDVAGKAGDYWMSQLNLGNPYGNTMPNSQGYSQSVAPSTDVTRTMGPEAKAYAEKFAMENPRGTAFGMNMLNGAMSMYGGIGSALGQEDMAKAADYYGKKYQDQQKKWKDKYGNDFSYWGYAGQGLGSMIATGPFAELTPAGAVAKGTGFIETVASKLPWVSKLAETPVGKEVIADVVKGAVGANIADATSEFGNVVHEQREDGKTYWDAASQSWQVIPENIILGAVTEGVSYPLTKGRLVQALLPKAGEGIGKRAAMTIPRAIPAIGINGVIEGGQEAYQQAISNAATGKEYGILPWNWTDDQWESFEGGAVGGAFISAPGNIGRAALSTRRNATDELRAAQELNAQLDSELQAKQQPTPQAEPQQAYQQATYQPQQTEAAAYTNPLTNAVIDAANEFGIDPNVALAVAARESGGDDINNIGNAQGVGVNVMQIEDKTAQYYGLSEKFPGWNTDPMQNIRAGMYILQQKTQEVGGDVNAGIKAYNGGGDPDYLNKVLHTMGGTMSMRDMPMQEGMEDTGLANTNVNLVNGAKQLNAWVYDTFGVDLTVSGGWRSKEHNAAVGGAEHSHHLDGEALDIVIPDNLSAEQVEQIKAKAREMGFNSDGEDMYHDRGSGYHLHLTLPSGHVNGGVATAQPISMNTFDEDLRSMRDDSYADTAEDILDSTDDMNEMDLFEGMFETDGKGNRKFKDTPENRQIIEQQYGEELENRVIKNMAQRALKTDAVKADSKLTGVLSKLIKNNDTAAMRGVLTKLYSTPSLDKLSGQKTAPTNQKQAQTQPVIPQAPKQGAVQPQVQPQAVQQGAAHTVQQGEVRHGNNQTTEPSTQAKQDNNENTEPKQAQVEANGKGVQAKQNTENQAVAQYQPTQVQAQPVQQQTQQPMSHTVQPNVPVSTTQLAQEKPYSAMSYGKFLGIMDETLTKLIARKGNTDAETVALQNKKQELHRIYKKVKEVAKQESAKNGLNFEKLFTKEQRKFMEQAWNEVRNSAVESGKKESTATPDRSNETPTQRDARVKAVNNFIVGYAKKHDGVDKETLKKAVHDKFEGRQDDVFEDAYAVASDVLAGKKNTPERTTRNGESEKARNKRVEDAKKSILEYALDNKLASDDKETFKKVVHDKYNGENDDVFNDAYTLAKDAMTLGEGYQTESGRPLYESDVNEFIIKSDGSMAFGHITKDIENATKGILKAGEIRLRVGNAGEGLVHAKKHESQAKSLGYKSIEDLMSDIASDFDAIYLQKADEKTKKDKYILVRYPKADEQKGIISPLYFEMQQGDSQFYNIITTYPKRKRSLFKEMKEEHLIYGSPAIAATAVPNDSPVLAPANNTVGVDRTVPPTSAKSSVLDTSVPQTAQNSNETSVSSEEAQRIQNQHKQDNWRQEMHAIVTTVYKGELRDKDYIREETQRILGEVEASDLFKGKKTLLRKKYEADRRAAYLAIEIDDGVNYSLEDIRKNPTTRTVKIAVNDLKSVLTDAQRRMDVVAGDSRVFPDDGINTYVKYVKDTISTLESFSSQQVDDHTVYEKLTEALSHNKKVRNEAVDAFIKERRLSEADNTLLHKVNVILTDVKKGNLTVKYAKDEIKRAVSQNQDVADYANGGTLSDMAKDIIREADARLKKIPENNVLAKKYMELGNAEVAARQQIENMVKAYTERKVITKDECINAINKVAETVPKGEIMHLNARRNIELEAKDAIKSLDWKYDIANPEEAAKREEQAKQEEIQKENAEYHGYLDAMTPMQRGRIIKALSKATRIDGKRYPTTREFIEEYIRNKGRIPKDHGHDYRLYNPEDNSFIQFNKTEYGYAEYYYQQVQKAISNIKKDSNNSHEDIVVTGNEFGEYKDLKDLRQKAIAYYAENLQGTTVNCPILGKVTLGKDWVVAFTRAGRGKIKITSANENKLFLIKYLPTLITSAKNITESAPLKEKHSEEYFYYLHTEATINGKRAPIIITLIRRNNGQIHFYNHNIVDDKNKDSALVYQEPASSNEALGTPADNALSNNSVSQENLNSNETENKETPNIKANDDNAVWNNGSLYNKKATGNASGIVNAIFNKKKNKQTKEDTAKAVSDGTVDLSKRTIDEATEKLKADFGVKPHKEPKLPTPPKPKEPVVKPRPTYAIKENAEAPKFMNVFDDSDEGLKKALEDFDKSVNTISMNPLFNPQTMLAALKIGGIFAQRGVNRFADWVAKISALQPKLKPFLSCVWETLQAMPKRGQLDEKLVLNTMEYITTMYYNGVTDKADIRTRFIAAVGEKNAIYFEPAYTAFIKYPTQGQIKEAWDSENIPNNIEVPVPTSKAAREALTSLFQKGKPMDVVRSFDEYVDSVIADVEAGNMTTKEASKDIAETYRALQAAPVYNKLQGFMKKNITLKDAEAQKRLKTGAITPKGVVSDGQVQTESDGSSGRHQGNEPQTVEGTESAGESGGHPRADRREDNGTSQGTGLSDVGGQTGRVQRGSAEVGTGVHGMSDDSDGNGTGGNTQSILTEKPKNNEVPGGNYHLEDVADFTKGSKKIKAAQNIAAIETLKKIEAENRMATPSEQAILAKYTGWGAISEIFTNNPDWKQAKERLQSVLTREEYDSCFKTVNDAFYTDPNIVGKIWDAVSRLGFKGGRVLDPSMGTGMFFSMMPKHMMAKSTLTGVELESIAGRISRQLHQKADVQIKGFEKLQVPDDYYDLAISNVPFGQFKPRDKRYDAFGYQIHNYFFAKAMDKVRPGGLVVFITGQGTMQSGTDAATLRNELAGKADLIAAVKLPNTAFKGANTKVTTDVLILRKRDAETPSAHAQRWDAAKTNVKGTEVNLNSYFQDHPENMFGTPTLTQAAQAGNKIFGLDGSNTDLLKSFDNFIKTLPTGVYAARKGKALDTVQANKTAAADAKTRDGAFVMKDGKPMQNDMGTLKEVSEPKKHRGRIERFVTLRDITKELFAKELDPKTTNEEIAQLRASLNKAYDDFVEKHGYLSTNSNNLALRDDPSYGNIAGLEHCEYTRKKTKRGTITRELSSVTKTSFFKERSIQPVKEVKKVDNPGDALIVSLLNKGRVDLEYMSQMSDMTQQELIAKLKGSIFLNPETASYETSEEYLSGDVVSKLEQAEEEAKTNPVYKENVEALKKVQPTKLVASEITFTFGAPWIEPRHVADYISSLTKNGATYTAAYNKALDQWAIAREGWRGPVTEYQTERADFVAIVEKALNGGVFPPRKQDTDEGKEREAALVQLTNQKVEDIRKGFTEWIQNDEERANELADYYNRHFNNTVLRQYNGAHLEFPGMNINIKLRDHQKNAVWRILQPKNVLLAHEVGTGKTFTMQAAGMTLKRLGICQKPLYTVPKNVVEQFSKEFKILYPGAKLLVLTNESLPTLKAPKEKVVKDENGKATIVQEPLTPKDIENNKAKRAQLLKTLTQIRTEDWDGVIISHQTYKRLAMSQAAYADFYNQQADEIRFGMAQLADAKDTESKRFAKDLSAKLKKIEAKIEEQLKVDDKYQGITFEETGIDQIFVDEADAFKNLTFTTKLGNVSGISTRDSQRSMDMFTKTQYLTKLNGGRGVVFATGTPISNTLNELYTMMRYLNMDTLKRTGNAYFDSWVKTFGKIISQTVRNSSGIGWKDVNTVTFANVPEMVKQFREVADVVKADDTNIVRPNIKNGKPTVIQIEPTQAQRDYIEKVIVERVKNAKSNGFKSKKGADNMLAITNDLRKASLDMRLIDPTLGEEEGNKIRAMADQVARVYEETQADKGAQLVFCDMGVPKEKSDSITDEEEEGTSSGMVVDEKVEADMYAKIMKAMLKRGIPKEQIAFVHDATSDAAKQDLFERVDRGEIRVIIGSTEKMGAGTNFQHHLAALHHFTVPWRPRDIEQRIGRILRQGNMFKEVEIFEYVTKDTYDAVAWEKLKNKAIMIAQVMSGDTTHRSIEDIGDDVCSYEEAEAIASGDPLFKEKVEVGNEISRYQTMKREHERNVTNAKADIPILTDAIETKEYVLSQVEDSMKKRVPINGDSFTVTIDGKTYTKRKEANAALQDKLKNLLGENQVPIGSVHNFDITASRTPDYTTADGTVFKTVLNLTYGNVSYKVNGDTMTAIEGAYNTAPEKQQELLSKEIDDKKLRLANAKELINQPFKYQDKLDELQERQQKLYTALGYDENGNKLDVTTAPNTADTQTANTNYSITTSTHPAIRRSVEEVKTEIRAQFPNGKITEEANRLIVKLPNGTVVFDIEEQVPMTEADYEQAKKSHGYDPNTPNSELAVGGRTRAKGNNAYVEIAQGGEWGVTFDEVYHVAEALALTDKELEAMKKGISKEKDMTNPYTGKPFDGTNEEERAEYYRTWKQKRANGKGTAFGRLCQKIQDMYYKIKAVMTKVENLHNVMRKIEQGEVWNNDNTEALKRQQENESKFSMYAKNKLKEDMAAFAKKIDEFVSGKLPDGSYVKVMDTPLVLNLIGEKSAPIYVTKDVLDKILNWKHGAEMSPRVMKEIPRRLADPIFILNARDKTGNMVADSKVVVIDLTDEKGATVMVPLKFETSKYTDGTPCTIIKSAYGKAKGENNDKPFNKWYIDRLKRGDCVYINKKRTDHWLAGLKTLAGAPNGSLVVDSFNLSPIIPNETDLGKLKAENPTRYSIQKMQEQYETISKQDTSFGNKAKEKLLKKLSKDNAGGKIKIIGKPTNPHEMGLGGYIMGSPSRLAQKNPLIRRFFEMGDRAMNYQTKMRADYMRKLDQAWNISKEGREQLTNILWNGDMQRKDYTEAELRAEGVSEEVITGYKRIRGLIRKMARQLNDAKQQITTKSGTFNDKTLNDLKEDKFVTEIVRVQEKARGEYLVTYKERRHWKEEHIVDEYELNDLLADEENVQLINKVEITEGRNAGKYEVTYLQGVEALHTRRGYIPHFFHEYVIKITDENGEPLMKPSIGGDGKEYMIPIVIGSGRTVNEAIKVAEEWQKHNELSDGMGLVISPQIENFDSDGAADYESGYKVTMGDKDYQTMVASIAKTQDMTLAEAKQIVEGGVKLASRHRFLGNLETRKGMEGYEKDMQWVLRHYFNLGSRYVAMETLFKPHAISLFERTIGSFEREYHGVNSYIKQYINDINGTPTAFEKQLNDLLASIPKVNKHLKAHFGDRLAVALSAKSAAAMSVLKLGGNISSAFLNICQLSNAVAYTGRMSTLGVALAKGLKGLKGGLKGYTMTERKILIETGVLDDLGLDSGAGYGKLHLGQLASISMKPFKESEGIVRRGVVLAAYKTAIERGKSHTAAIEYAKECNRKSNFDYGVSDAPNVFRRGSAVAQVALQFKKYGIKQLEVMNDFLPFVTRTMDDGTKISMRQKAYFWGTYFALAGLTDSIPFSNAICDLIAFVMGWDPREAAKEGLMRIANEYPMLKPLCKVAMYGIGSAVDVNIANRVGIGDVVAMEAIQLAGPTISTVVTTGRDIRRVAQGQASPVQLLKDISPGLGNLATAVIGERVGSRGRVTQTYDDIDDRLKKAMGFQSVRESDAYLTQKMLTNEKKKHQSERQQIIDDFIADESAENARRLKEAGITKKQVEAERQKKKQTASERMKNGMNKREQELYGYITNW